MLSLSCAANKHSTQKVTFSVYLAWCTVCWLTKLVLSIMQDSGQFKQVLTTMVLPSLSSPDGKSQNTFFSSSLSKKLSGRDELGSWSTILERHRFLLTMMVLLAFLCTIYLYFAVTLGGLRSLSWKVWSWEGTLWDEIFFIQGKTEIILTWNAPRNSCHGTSLGFRGNSSSSGCCLILQTWRFIFIVRIV